MKRIICILLVFVIALSGCSRKKDSDTSWQEQYDLGVRYLSEGNYEEAIIAFTAAIEIDPKKPDTYIGLYEAYVAVGDYESAQAAIDSGREECGNRSEFDDAQNALDKLFSDDSEMQMYIDSERLTEALRSGVLTFDDLPAVFSTPFNQVGNLIGVSSGDIRTRTESGSFRGLEYEDLSLQECDYWDHELAASGYYIRATAPLSSSAVLYFEVDDSNAVLNGEAIAALPAGWKGISIGDSMESVLAKLGLDPALSTYSNINICLNENMANSIAWVDTEETGMIGDVPEDGILYIAFDSEGNDYLGEYSVDLMFVDGGSLSSVSYRNDALYAALLSGEYEGSSGEQTGAGQNSSSDDVFAPSVTPDYSPSSSVGSIVQFGSYEQDNNFDNGAEPINWLVIDEDPITGQVLLLSTRGLDCQKYHKERVSVSWSNSDIRSWLNSTFLSKAFTATDRARIAETPTASDGSCYDRVFFLDENEIYKYQSILEDSGYEEIPPTAYAEAQGAYSDDGQWCWWWVRTHEADKVVDRTDDCDVIGGDVTLNFVSIRPAVWVTL